MVSLGYRQEQIIAVTSYQEAIKAVEVRHYDVLIMDYHLEQSITGYELTTLLFNNRLINDSTGILIISGDSRQETVLTSLSGRVKHFIMKPIKTKDLGEKLNILHQETSILSQVKTLLRNPKTDTIYQLLEYAQQLNFAISFESSLIELLVTSKQWDILDEFLNHSDSSNHPTKECARAMLLNRAGDVQHAINALAQYLVLKPLSLNVMDYLSELYEQEHNREEALYWALKAFEFTPSVSDRAIRAGKLAAEINNREAVIKIGYTFANHISLTDNHWLQSIIEYGHCLERVYVKAEQARSKKELLQHFSHFLKMTEKRLPNSRKKNLISYRLVFQCRLLLQENKLTGAHKKILLSISTYYDNLSLCPVPLAHEILPILELFGELWLHKYLSKLFGTQNNQSSAPDKTPFDVEHLKELYEILPSGGAREHDSDTIAIYEMIINLFPYSTEAKIRYLHAVRSSNDEPNHNPVSLLSTLSELELPPNWNRWLIGVRNANTYTEPPAPFSLVI